jgi:flagellar biogenesis protein FliO
VIAAFALLRPTSARAQGVAATAEVAKTAAATKPAEQAIPVEGPQQTALAVQETQSLEPNVAPEPAAAAAPPIVMPLPSPLPVVDPNEALWSGAKTLGATLLVIALILATAVLLKRHMPHHFGGLGKKKRIHILESVGLGEKRSLTLVEIDGLHLLLASSGNNVSLIKEFVTADGQPTHPFKQELTAELAKMDETPDYKKALGRLSRIRQDIEVR